jgi:Lectin C-type domain
MTYILLVQQETYMEAGASCCDLGMGLVSVESLNEYQCLVNQNRADMRYINKIFWTSGSDRDCPFNFKWCTATTNVSFYANSIQWQPGQPNNMNGVQDCVQLTLNAANVSENSYNDEPCLYANHFICEV